MLLGRAIECSILYQNQGHDKIECFADADWARPKVYVRYCVFIGGNLVLWKVRSGSLSSAKSKYKAMAQVA